MWIHSAKVDLIFFSFGWLIVLLAFLLVDQFGFQGKGRWFVISFVLLTSLFHRHLTFPLVYGDKKVFETRKKTFTYVPIFVLLFAVGALLYIKKPTFTTSSITQSITFQEGDSLLAHLRADKKSKNVRIKFTPGEQSLSQVAATFQEPLKGWLSVAVVGDSLKFSPAPDSGLKRFTFGAFRGKDLQMRLGFPTVGSLGWKESRPVFIFLILLSAFWNIYHTLMQKMGILRVYSRKVNRGKPWLDKAMVFVWFGWLFFALANSSAARSQVARMGNSGRFMVDMVQPVFEVLPWIARGFLIAGIVVTVLYLIEEFKGNHPINWPKNLFLISILAIYITFFYDFLVGFAIFGFAHAIEYLAFVNIFSKKKYTGPKVAPSLMAKWVRRQGLYFALFMGLSIVIFVPWYFEAAVTLNWYIVSTSFLHFLYDGWIWKVRNPKVGEPLGISYQNTTGITPQPQVA